MLKYTNNLNLPMRAFLLRTAAAVEQFREEKGGMMALLKLHSLTLR